MPDAKLHLSKCLASVVSQSFTDYEILVTNSGKMAENTNDGMMRASGEIIKILYMDDRFAHPDALQQIVDAFEGRDEKWLVTGCDHEPGTHTHLPTWNDKLTQGVNTIGSPSVMAMKVKELFDENMSWLLDVDLYHRLNEKYGQPIYLDDINVTIGLHAGQTTFLMADEAKLAEHNYLKEKYESILRKSRLWR